jgi:hypothetical protein
MTTYKMIDASRPPDAADGEFSVVMGYVGGNTPHVWTAGEWQVFASYRQVPAYVPDLGSSPTAEAAYAVAAVKRLGWAAHEEDTRIIVIDFETTINRAWYASMASGIVSAGFAPVIYGSLSTVFENAADDVLAADFDDVPSIPAGQTLHGLQYLSDQEYEGTEVDWSIVDQWFHDRGGVGPRKMLCGSSITC